MKAQQTPLRFSCYMMLGITFFLIFRSSGRAQIQPAPVELLQRARSRFKFDVSNQARYTCTQDVVRRVYRGTSKKPVNCAQIIASGDDGKHDVSLTSWDHVVLDVAIADNREIHGWNGAPTFAENEIQELVGNGGFGSGDLAAFIAGIFGSAATVQFQKIRRTQGRALLEYQFEVPGSASNYKVAHWGRAIAVGYSGTFLLDLQTADLKQIVVRTAELPSETEACQAVSKIDYERIDIHGIQALIPGQTNLRTTYRDGGQTSSATSYSGCHEYNGKAVLRFDHTETASMPSDLKTRFEASTSPVRPFPAGLKFDCRIVTPLNSDIPAGRPVEAILLSPIFAEDGAILAPAGTHIDGRVVHFGQHIGRPSYYAIAVRLDSIEVDGIKIPLFATLGHQAEPPAASGKSDHEAQFSDLINLPQNVGTFFFATNHLNVREWDSTWFTKSPDSFKSAPSKGIVQSPSLDANLLQTFLLAIQYSERATKLQKDTRGARTLLKDPNLSEILTNRRKSIEIGTSLNITSLNDRYPGLGDRFRNEFIEAASLFVHACEIYSSSEGVAKAELGRSVLLADEWANWYGTRLEDIKESLGRVH